jgi:hypothetical protein
VRELAVGGGVDRQWHVAVAAQRPVGLEERRRRVIGPERMPLLDQDPADLMIDVRV